MATGGNEHAPKDIQFDSIVVDLCFHPSRDVIAAGDIDGDVTVYSYSTAEDNHLLLTLPHHKKSCRAVRFSPDGSKLLTASKDKSIQVVDMGEGKVVKNLDKAHKSAIYSLLVVNENIIASGDDDGQLKVWDLRLNKTVMDLKECEEFISDMAIEERNRLLLATSGDGSLSAYDIRHHKLKVKSETFEAEFLSLGIVKNQRKVVCGAGDGVLNIFNWNEWGYISDRFPGHPMSIDCVLPISPDIILTGSIDGYIRVVNILPNRLIGLLGQHENFPIENLSLSRCAKYVASCSHDQKIKFWNIEGIDNAEVDANAKPKRTFKKPLGKEGKSNFFADLQDPSTSDDKNKSESRDDSDDDDDSSSDDDNDDKKQNNDSQTRDAGKSDNQDVESDSEPDSDEDSVHETVEKT